MKNSKRILPKVKTVLQANKFGITDKLQFLSTILFKYFFYGKKRMEKEVLEWQETLDIINNQEYQKNLKEVEKRIAFLNKNGNQRTNCYKPCMDNR